MKEVRDLQDLTRTHPNRCVVVTEAGSYLRRIDLCVTQLKAQGPSRTCNESKEEEEEASAPAETRHAESVILREEHDHTLVKDSEQLPHPRRSSLFITLKPRVE